MNPEKKPFKLVFPPGDHVIIFRILSLGPIFMLYFIIHGLWIKHKPLDLLSIVVLLFVISLLLFMLWAITYGQVIQSVYRLNSNGCNIFKRFFLIKFNFRNVTWPEVKSIFIESRPGNMTGRRLHQLVMQLASNEKLYLYADGDMAKAQDIRDKIIILSQIDLK